MRNGFLHRCFIIVVVAAIVGMVLNTTACSTSSDGSGYEGISEQYPTGSPQIFTDNLVAAFDMQTLTSDGLLYDFSPFAHHSVVMGTMVTEGLFGDALIFRTTGDRIDMPETSAFDIDGPLSIGLWFRVDTIDLHQHLIAVDDKFVVWINQANQIRFTDTQGNGLETIDAIEAGRWYSLGAVFDGSIGTQLTSENIRLYLDGEPVQINIVGQNSGKTFYWSPGDLFPDDAAYIGFESHQGEPLHQELPFVGVIDEVLLFRRSLSLKEIVAHADGDF